MKLTNSIKVTKPDPASTNPALATGGMTAVGALVALLVMRYLGADPEVAFGIGMVAGPVITAALIRLRVYSPATVARLLAARDVQAGDKR